MIVKKAEEEKGQALKIGERKRAKKQDRKWNKRKKDDRSR